MRGRRSLRKAPSWVSSGAVLDKRPAIPHTGPAHETWRRSVQPPDEHGERSMAQPYETIEVTDHTVACDGGDGALGHPRVFLEIPEDEHKVVCPYCSRTYVLVGHGDDEKAA